MSRSTGGINCVLPQLQALRTSDHGCGPPKPGGPERSSWALTSRFLPDGTPPSRTSGLMPSWAVNLLSLHAHPRPPPLCGAMGLFWGLRPCPRSRPRQKEGVMNENTTSHSPASHRATCTALCVTRGASCDPRRQPSPNGLRQLGWQPAKMPRGVHALCRLLGLHCALGLAIRDRVWRNVVGCHFCEEVRRLRLPSRPLSCPLSFVRSAGSRRRVTSCPWRGPPGRGLGAASSQRPAGN